MRVLAIAAAVLAPVALSADDPDSRAWRQWGGPNRNFVVEAEGLAGEWPDAGPPVLWSRPLGTGHSAILAEDRRLYTLYRVGNGRAKQGPWEAEEIVVALDARTGETLWEFRYPSKREDFNFGAGPHSTPLLVGDRLFTIGMVAVGLATLLSFNWPIVGAELSDFAYLISVGGLIYTVLPLAGASWLLAKSWRFLLADRGGVNVERRTRLGRERRDDWRLDA